VTKNLPQSKTKERSRRVVGLSFVVDDEVVVLVFAGWTQVGTEGGVGVPVL